MTPERLAELEALLDGPAHRQCQKKWQAICRELLGYLIEDSKKDGTDD